MLVVCKISSHVPFSSSFHSHAERASRQTARSRSSTYRCKSHNLVGIHVSALFEEFRTRANAPSNLAGSQERLSVRIALCSMSLYLLIHRLELQKAKLA